MLHPSLQSSLVSVLSTLCLSLTPISCFRLFPVIDLIMLYSSLLLPFSAAFSAAATLFSYQFLLFPVVLHFTTLFFALYSSLRLCFSRSDLAPSNFNFASFLSLIFSHVLLPIHGLLCFFDLSTSFFAASLYVAKIMSCSSFGSSMSPNALNVFLTSMLYLLLISSLCSIRMSNLSLTFFLLSALANLRRIHVKYQRVVVWPYFYSHSNSDLILPNAGILILSFQTMEFWPYF